MTIPPAVTKLLCVIDMCIIALFLYKFLMENFYFGHLLWVIFFTWNAIQCKEQIIRDEIGAK